MNDFAFYFQLGLEHILSPEALDHLLFVTVLTCMFTHREFRKLLILVTAFTVGHSVTLALSALNIIRINDSLVEFLIPLTILITALLNLIQHKKANDQKISWKYILALAFGLIHGLGFANTVRMAISGEQSIVTPLLSFNLGLEAGQIIVVFCLLLIGYLWTRLGLKRSWWIILCSIVGLIISAYMCITRLPV